MTPSGKGDPNAPALIPGWAKSRTYSLLAGRAFSTHAEFYWRYDPFTGDQWGQVLEYQAKKGRNVIGLSPAGVAKVKVQAWAKWAKFKLGQVPAAKQKVAVGVGIPEVGNYNTTHATFGIGVTSAEKFSSGQWTGAMTAGEWKKYFRGEASANVPAKPGPGYNRLLAHTWGQGFRPGGSGSAVPGPTGPGPRIPKPKPKLTPVKSAFELYPNQWALPIRGRKINTPPEPYGYNLPSDESLEKKKTQKTPKPKLPAFPKTGENLQPVRALGGSTRAKLVKDASGKQYVFKQGGNPGHLREEVAADELYRAIGLDVPRSKLYERAGGPAKLSEFHEGKTLGELEHSDPAAYQAAVKELRKGFVADALLGNWDAIGASGDNVLVTPDGRVLRIDNGGSLRYRAQGKLKSPSQWGNAVGELSSLRNAGINPSTAKIYGGITDDEIKAQIKGVLKRKAAILKAAPPEVKATLEQRLAYLKDWGKPQKPIKVGNWKATPADQFKTFSTTDQADAWAKATYADWKKELTSDEIEAIGNYKGSGYVMINQYTRGADRHGNAVDPQHAPKYVKEAWKHLDSALHKNPLPEPVTVVRYFSLSDVGLTRDQVKLGYDIPDKAYVSTSVNPHWIWSGQRFEIRLPKGTPAGYVKIATSSMQSEYELLLCRDDKRKFRVVEFKDDSHKTIVLELIHPTVHADKKPRATQ